MGRPNQFHCVEDFDCLRWKRARVYIGDSPDYRTIREIFFPSRIRHCFPSHPWRRIELADGNTIRITGRNTGVLRGKTVYLFREGGVLDQVWRKWHLGQRFIARLQVLPLPDAQAAVELFLRGAGATYPCHLVSMPVLLSVVEGYLVSVGVPHLEDLVGLIEYAPPACAAAAA